MNAGARLRLDHAEQLLTGSDLAGVWPRCTAWLLRLSLEHALAQLWASRYLAVNKCSMRAQLLALTKVVDTDTQHRVSELWQILSHAGHHHHYELSVRREALDFSNGGERPSSLDCHSSPVKLRAA